MTAWRPLAASWLAGLLCLAIVRNADADDDVTLFRGDGVPVAYIAVSDELTIYLWSGKPVAYLNGSDDVYGFNGKHLGWFSVGVIWDHNGNAACAVKARLTYTDTEPFKFFKQFKPFKSFAEFAPSRPSFTNSFTAMPCETLLEQGIS